MTLTTLYHDGTQNTAGGMLRHTQVDWISIPYRMHLCPLPTDRPRRIFDAHSASSGIWRNETVYM